jgi:hypothetical protein
MWRYLSAFTGRTTKQTTNGSASNTYHALLQESRPPSSRWENDKHAAACSSKPGGYGKPHQEFRVILHLLLLRLEHLNGDNDKDEEMSGLQELKKGGKRTILS